MRNRGTTRTFCTSRRKVARAATATEFELRFRNLSASTSAHSPNPRADFRKDPCGAGALRGTPAFRLAMATPRMRRSCLASYVTVSSRHASPAPRMRRPCPASHVTISSHYASYAAAMPCKRCDGLVPPRLASGGHASQAMPCLTCGACSSFCFGSAAVGARFVPTCGTARRG